MNHCVRELCSRCGGVRTLHGQLGSRGELNLFGGESVSGFWEMPVGSYCPRGHNWKRLKKGEYV